MPGAAVGAVLAGVVGGEHNAVGSDGGNGVGQHPVAEDATGGDVQVAGDVLGDAPLQVGCPVAEHVGAFEEENQHLTPVPQDELQVWVAVEGAGQYQPQGGDASVGMPAPAAGSQYGVDVVAESAEVDVTDGVWRYFWVNVQRHAEPGGGFEYWPEPVVVEIQIAGAGEEHGAGESKSADGAFQFLGRGGGVGGRQGREGREPVRLCRDRCRQHVVGLAG
jgi:hypothetical protein